MRANTSTSRAARQSPRRGGVGAWLLGGLLICGALATLAWMLLLPGLVQSRFSTLSGGAALSLQGLMGDPFAGRATVTGWQLRASQDPNAKILAEGKTSQLLATDWQRALDARPGASVVLDSAEIHATRLVLAPDADGKWPLLALAAAAGLPYESRGPIGAEAPRVRVKKLLLRVDAVVVRDARTGRDQTVRIDWRGEYRDLDHSRPIVAALLAAVAAQRPDSDASH